MAVISIAAQASATATAGLTRVPRLCELHRAVSKFIILIVAQRERLALRRSVAASPGTVRISTVMAMVLAVNDPLNYFGMVVIGRRLLTSVCAACLGVLLLASCSDETSDDVQYIAEELGVSDEKAGELLDEYGNPEDAVDDYQDAIREPFDEEAATQAAEEDLAAEGYDYRYGCTEDCSGHEAGWQWRAEHGYSTPGYSDSFDEGGRALDEAVEERVDEMRENYDAGADPY